ncbi:sulfite exporter TauE/SafE family protein [Rhodopseudomonas palustris]|uniref:sulfite exporter TauE/SafE family protein n=1 Tax=Rhodopseudomonas palustris TaxID=1076 RepID=UPI0020CD03CF|nr:sulfite exporter TauE/SafE family protein [Rhodopseudomonas palustris]MCP9627459.1 sulfite exporter TauE/SafE family protein [Rhodopseudomonas palustris]
MTITTGMHFIGGAVLGLAGSLHCAGLCGGIASSLLLATSSPDAAASGRAATLLRIQLGRTLSYTLFGAAVGAGGAAFGGLVTLAGLQPAMRIAAACALAWTGLSVAGLFPGFRVIDRALAMASSIRTRSSRRPPLPSSLALGIAWGFAPCGMVYAALLNAMLSGSTLAGAEFMAGFGLATIPAVAAAAFGVTTLASARVSRRGVRSALGAALVALGAASMIEPAMSLAALCIGA